MCTLWQDDCAYPAFRYMCAAAEGQYLSLQKLLEGFSSYSARAPNRYLRPVCRPDSPQNARQWWQYAGAVARRQLRSQSFNWRQFERVSMRVELLEAQILTNTLCQDFSRQKHVCHRQLERLQAGLTKVACSLLRRGRDGHHSAAGCGPAWNISDAWMQAIEYRSRYVQQYVQCLQDGKMGGDEVHSRDGC